MEGNIPNLANEYAIVSTEFVDLDEVSFGSRSTLIARPLTYHLRDPRDIVVAATYESNECLPRVLS
jgi:hypothetical protein